MKASLKENAPLLGAVVIALVIIAGGWYVHEVRNKPEPYTIPTVYQHYETEATTTPLTYAGPNCSGFDALSQYVLSSIQKPDTTEVVSKTDQYMPVFIWKRSASEPFVTYPMLRGVIARYEGERPYGRTHDEIAKIDHDNSETIQANITKLASSLGLTTDPLNTYPYESFPEQDESLTVFGFTKGIDHYSVIVFGAGGAHQAPPGTYVEVVCGTTIPQLDALYDAFHLTPYPDYPYEWSYEFQGGTVILASMGEQNIFGFYSFKPVLINGYYYLDGNTAGQIKSGYDGTPVSYQGPLGWQGGVK